MTQAVHTVTFGITSIRSSNWFTDPAIADSHFDAIEAAPEARSFTLSRFGLEVPVGASASQISSLVEQAATEISF